MSRLVLPLTTQYSTSASRKVSLKLAIDKSKLLAKPCALGDADGVVELVWQQGGAAFDWSGRFSQQDTQGMFLTRYAEPVPLTVR